MRKNNCSASVLSNPVNWLMYYFSCESIAAGPINLLTGSWKISFSPFAGSSVADATSKHYFFHSLTLSPRTPVSLSRVNNAFSLLAYHSITRECFSIATYVRSHEIQFTLSIEPLISIIQVTWSSIFFRWMWTSVFQSHNRQRGCTFSLVLRADRAVVLLYPSSCEVLLLSEDVLEVSRWVLCSVKIEVTVARASERAVSLPFGRCDCRHFSRRKRREE